MSEHLDLAEERIASAARPGMSRDASLVALTHAVIHLLSAIAALEARVEELERDAA